MDIANLLSVEIRAPLAPLDGDLARAEQKTKAFDREASRAFRGVDKAAKDTGRSIKGMAAEAAVANDNIRGSAMRTALSLGDLRMHVLAVGSAIAVAFASIQPIFAFKDEIAEVSTLVDMATFNMHRLETSALAMAAAFGGGAVSQVRAFNDVISAGTEDLAAATRIVEAANKLAVGGASSVAIATNGLTNILNAYGDKVGSATEVSDAMFIAMRDGKTTVEELASSLGRVAPIAAQTNVTFDELTAAIAALTLGGISTAESVTGVRAMLAAVAKPTQQATELANKLGIEFNTTGLRAKGLVGFLQELMTKTGGSTDALAILFGGVEALVPAMALAGSAGKSFANTMENMAGKAGATEEAFNKMANSPGFQAGRMWSALQAEIIGAGGALDALVPLMKAVADNMGLIVTAATIFTAGHLVAAIVPVIAQIAALTAGMGAAAVAARALSLAMAFFGGPIGIAVAALAVAYLLLRDNVTAAEQATLDAKGAYDVNEKALNDSKAASEGYTQALRDQIAMQVEAARTAHMAAEDNFFAASARRASFENVTGLNFAPLVYSQKTAEKESLATGAALERLEGQLARVDANMQKTAESTTAAGAALGEAAQGADEAANAYARIVQSAREFIAEQELERRALGMTEEEANRLRYEMEMLNAAHRAGIELTPQQTSELQKLAAQMSRSEAETRRQQDAIEGMKRAWESFGDGAGDILTGLFTKTMTWKEALIAAIPLVRDLLLEFLKAQSVGSGSGDFLSFLFKGISGLFGGGGGGGGDPWAGLRLDRSPAAAAAAMPVPNAAPAAVAVRSAQLAYASPGGMPSRGGVGAVDAPANQNGSYTDARVFHIDARGAQEGVAQQIVEALEKYDATLPNKVQGKIHEDRRTPRRVTGTW
jgi:TP901 family phage tail tape measure protein